MMSDINDMPLSEKQAEKAYQVVSSNLLCAKGKELQRFIKRENEIREVYNVTTDDIKSFTTFEQAE